MERCSICFHLKENVALSELKVVDENGDGYARPLCLYHAQRLSEKLESLQVEEHELGTRRLHVGLWP